MISILDGMRFGLGVLFDAVIVMFVITLLGWIWSAWIE
jgi:hypothetical protein